MQVYVSTKVKPQTQIQNPNTNQKPQATQKGIPQSTAPTQTQNQKNPTQPPQLEDTKHKTQTLYTQTHSQINQKTTTPGFLYYVNPTANKKPGDTQLQTKSNQNLEETPKHKTSIPPESS